MATAQVPVPEPMCIKGDTQENWKLFRFSFENYLVASELDKKDAKIQCATLLTVLGRESLRIYQKLQLAPTECNTVSKILDALQSYFTPKLNTTFERFVFGTTNQEVGEPINAYVGRLRELAQTCAYGDKVDEFIRDRMVLGISDQETRKRLLGVSDLTLQGALNMSQSSEMTNKHLEKINQAAQPETVHKTAQQSYPKRDKGDKEGKTKQKSDKFDRPKQCKYCGGRHVWKKSECPAAGQTCTKCGKLDHFKKVCMQAKKKNVHTLEDTEPDSDSEDSVYTVSLQQTVGTVEQKGKQLFVKLQMKVGEATKYVKCQLDTGATCNTISLKEYKRITGENNPSMHHSSDRLKCYGGEIIKPCGKVNISCTTTEQTKGKFSFQVIDLPQRPLLSAETCQALGLVKINGKLCTIQAESGESVGKPLEYFLQEYDDVFRGLGRLPGEYHLETDPNVTPVQHLPRRVPVALKTEVQTKIAQLEEAGIIRKVSEPSSWISSMVAVKRGNKLRVCIDPRDLNKSLKRSHYQLPKIEEILPDLVGARVFTVVDAKDGFLQVALDDESSKLTTFWTPSGRYRWLRMPFGIAPAPEEFQRRIHEHLHGLPGVSIIADDILICGKGDTDEAAAADHDKNLENLLRRAREVNLKLNKTKIKYRLSEIPYIGHCLSADGVKPDKMKTEAVRDMKQPANVTEVQRFLGFVNYLSKFLPALSEVAEPLRRLTDASSEWAWQSQQEDAFNTIKRLVTSAPLLKYYDVTDEVTIQCDASDIGIGTALLQQGQPVAFASRTLSKTERSYAVIEKECLAIVFACERFDQYLRGKELIHVNTDHKPLVTIFKKSILQVPKRLQRMLLRLQNYNLEVNYKPGKTMLIADLLSRAALPESGKKYEPDYVVYKMQHEERLFNEIQEINMTEHVNVTKERLRQIQSSTAQDEALQTLTSTIMTGWPPTRDQVPIIIREYWNYREELSMQNGVLFRGSRIIIPKQMRPEMLIRIHSSHLGPESCLRKARDTVFWPLMSQEIRDKISQCSTCNEFADNQQKQTLPTHPTPTLPWKRVALDTLHVKDELYLVTVDYYSDFWELDQLENSQSETLIATTKKNFARHGIPEVVITDNDTPFVSSAFRHFASDWEFEHNTISPRHSQSNGKVEATVKIAKKILKKTKRENTDLWKAILDWRNTPTQSMSSSPVQRLMSRRTRTLMPITSQLLYPKVEDGVKDKINLKKQKMKRSFDTHSKEYPDLEVGEGIRLKPNPEWKDQRWKPGVVSEKLSSRSYVVKVGGKEYRRNRVFLRQSKENDLHADSEVIERPEDPAVHVPERQHDTPEFATVPASPLKTTQTSASPRKTRSGRTVTMPAKFRD